MRRWASFDERWAAAVPPLSSDAVVKVVSKQHVLRHAVAAEIFDGTSGLEAKRGR